uniref:Remorin C-terminal domain-containing protein n=1 Tax=Oryza punctata TaxID=4537 RepID=A0A0E0K817_ORYPU
MLLGLEKNQHNGEDTSPEANDSGELDDQSKSTTPENGVAQLNHSHLRIHQTLIASTGSMECSTSTEMSSNSGHRSRNRAQDDDSFDSESSSSGPPTVKRPAAVTALLPPFSRPTPSKWDDAEKWISSPTANRGGRVGSAAGAAPKKSALAFPEHVSRPPAVAKVVAEVPSNTGTLVKNSVALAQPISFNPAQSASIVDEPAPAVRSVSMRDMGTEMTPIASQQPSRTGTPIIASSPTSSRTPTPQRNAEISIGEFGPSKMEMSEEELQMNTRKEIMDLGQRLGKTTIAAWASKEEKSTTSFADIITDKAVEIDRETRAADWEEAEKAKYLARFQREEVKIQAWENHQKAKIEAEMKRIEAKIEIKRAHEQDRLSSKLAAARHKAEARREAAEARKNQEAARTEEQAAQIRKTGHIPSSISCWCWCL